jgi:hypothetical protein
MATVHQTNLPQPSLTPAVPNAAELPELRLYSHSSLFYWWPVWTVGFLFAVLTAVQGEYLTMPDGRAYLMHPSKNIGVFYTVTLLLVIFMTNVILRGLTSVTVIITILFFTVLFAWLDWWETILSWLHQLSMYMNLGFYVVASTGLFIMWALGFFVFDRMAYWSIRPGQMTFERVVGTGEHSYDTRGMVLEKQLNDFFRHQLLGLGSGDLIIRTSGANPEVIQVPNVLFIHRKVAQIQKLIAVKPTDITEHVVTAGTPE